MFKEFFYRLYLLVLVRNNNKYEAKHTASMILSSFQVINIITLIQIVRCIINLKFDKLYILVWLLILIISIFVFNYYYLTMNLKKIEQKYSHLTKQQLTLSKMYLILYMVLTVGISYLLQLLYVYIWH